MGDEFGPLAFSPGAEDWIEYSVNGDRRRVGFHDYAAIYAVPGLYERVFYTELGMCSCVVVVEAFAAVLADLGRDPAVERVLDLGAGNGMGGEELRRAGVGRVVGLDLEPAARAAALRDRPGVYDDYVIDDLSALAPDSRAALEGEHFTSILGLSAIGVGHIEPAALQVALDLLEPGGLFGFAVTPALLPGSQDPAGVATGYPDMLAGLLADGAELARREYVHRRQVDGTPHAAVALIGRVPQRA